MTPHPGGKAILVETRRKREKVALSLQPSKTERNGERAGRATRAPSVRGQGPENV